MHLRCISKRVSDAMSSLFGKGADFGFALYKKPQYIVTAAKRKYGRHIFVLGATQENISTFWDHVGYGLHPDNQISTPVEKGRTIIDIDTKIHINDSTKELENEEKPEDWYDDFQITSKKSKGETSSSSKSYSLQLVKESSAQVGGNFKIAGSGFFNIATAGIAPSLGLSANFSKLSSKTTIEETKETNDETLNQEYEILDGFKVPPMSKIKVTITTWAVTYESEVKTRLTVDSKTKIPIKYRTPLAQLLGGFGTSNGFLTAKELFCNECEFEDNGTNITFSRMSKMSYLGEEVEIIKDENRLETTPNY